MEYLLTFRDRMEHAKELLTDDSKTAFFFITLPEALPIAVIQRFLKWFEEFGIPVGGVVVNMRIDPADLGDNPPEFVRNRIEMQREYMEEIWDRFDSVRAIVPLFQTQVQGVDMLGQVSRHLFSE